VALDVTIAAKKVRFVVVHYHIFKNAGTTVERILEREFPGAFAKLHGPTPDCTLDAEDLAAFLEDHPDVKAITSHHLRYPIPAIRNTVVFDCCFLRHPLDRLDSLYSYLQKIDSTNAQRQSPAEFLRHLIERSPEQVSNVQVTYLANRGAFTRPANTGDLDDAVKVMRNMAFPGVVEMFQESMVAAEYFMRPAFPSILLGAPAANVSRPGIHDPSEREWRLIERWGRGLYNELARRNELDIELFESARQEIRQRLSLIPSLSERMEEVGNRSLIRRA
jgi:hypothetical protein